MNFGNLKIFIKHFEYLKNIIDRDVFIVGGSIRDVLLNINNNPIDIDLTTKGDPDEIYSKIKKEKIHIFKTEKFGTITILTEDKSIKYEITPLRKEGKYMDFRHPHEISWSDSIIEDSKRRDFTINSLYLYYTEIEIPNYFGSGKNKIFQEDDINIVYINDNLLIEELFKNGNFNKKNFIENIKNFDVNLKNKTSKTFFLLDPQNGLNDLNKRIIKAVGNEDDRFKEDALRIIRGIRIAIQLNENLNNNFFDFDNKTWYSMKKNYYLVKFIAKERIKEEILKVFKGKNPFGFIALCDELNILKFIFPGIENIKNVKQPTRYHPLDTYHHTLMCLYHLQQINNDYLTRIAILYHDVGKPDQYYYAGITNIEDRKKIYGSYIHHSYRGTLIAEEDLKNLGFSKKEIETINWYIQMHLLPGEWLKGNEKTIINNLRKLLSLKGLDISLNLLDICIADRLGQYNPLQNNIDDLIKLKKMLIKIYEEEGNIKLKDLKVNGYDIMKHLNLTSGPIIGKILKKLHELVLDNPKLNEKEILLKEAKFIYNNIIKDLQ